MSPTETDNVQALLKRITELEQRNTELRIMFLDLLKIAYGAIGHVGAANYPERQAEARGWIHGMEDKYYEAIRLPR